MSHRRLKFRKTSRRQWPTCINAAAGEIAGVEPQFQKINGQDQKAYILSVNVNRRHMTAAQRAMATAMIYPAGAKGGRGKKNSSVSEGFSSTRLSMARAVLAHSPPIATAVLAGVAYACGRRFMRPERKGR